MSQIAIMSNINNGVSINITSYDYRAICLFGACIIYALFGSPTPSNFGIVEFLIGAFLALSIGIGRAHDVLLQPKMHFWKSAGRAFLVYGLSIPLLVGVLSGHNFGAILRDLIPFLFLFLPIFLLPLFRARPYYFRIILFAVLVIGFLFSLRSIFEDFSGELLYLENMPTVLFSALFTIGMAMSFIMRGLKLKNIAIFIILIVMSLLPIMAMAMTLQRASLGAVIFYIVLILGYFFYKSPARAIALVIIGVVFLLVINISFASIFASLWDKTAKVGLNMRPQEFAAVWDVICVDLRTFLFGIGWGGQFNSPAVGNLSVNFTHNFFSSVLLKTGALGVVCCISYIIGLLERLSRVVLKNPVLGLALSAPILIDLSLYASFKSLDFGLVLLMISGSLVYSRHSESLQVT